MNDEEKDSTPTEVVVSAVGKCPTCGRDKTNS